MLVISYQNTNKGGQRVVYLESILCRLWLAIRPLAPGIMFIIAIFCKRSNKRSKS